VRKFQNQKIKNMQQKPTRKERVENLLRLAQQDRNAPKVFQAIYLLRELTRREFIKQQS